MEEKLSEWERLGERIKRKIREEIYGGIFMEIRKRETILKLTNIISIGRK